MRVLKVEARGLVTSFRRPHFKYGIQPTFRMPPPATIYGHICSTLGELVPPESVAFAYHFTAEASFSDVEHIHLVAAATGKLEGTGLPKVLEGKVNPFKRELLFRPCLTLYITRPEWEAAFRRPRYAVVLGRSQDLFSYTSIKVIELEQAQHAYFEHTLLPYTMAVQVGSGIVELMPRYIDYERRRADTNFRTPQVGETKVNQRSVPTLGEDIAGIQKSQVELNYGQYLLLEQRAHSDDFWTFGAESALYWVDPTSKPDEKRGTLLGLYFHTFVGGAYAPGILA